MFTNEEMSTILEIAYFAFKHNKIPIKYQQDYILTLKTYLEDGCPKCLGPDKSKIGE